MTTAAVTVLLDRVHVLEVTLQHVVTRLELLAKGGTLPHDSLLLSIAEARRVLHGDEPN
jgi:hypothetical protein